MSVSKALEKVVEQMRQSPNNVRFSDLCRVCDQFFGEAHQKGTSHRRYEIGLPDEPPIDVQDDRGKAKAYQVRQVLKALDLKAEG